MKAKAPMVSEVLAIVRALVTALAATAVLAGVALGASAADRQDVDAVVAANNSFTFDLYAKLAEDKGNVFFSPYSISSALAMTYAGARGRTAQQMANALHFGLPQDRLHGALSQLMAGLNAEGKAYKLSVANALWGQIGQRFKPEFLDITNKYYGAGFKEVDYTEEVARERTRQTINGWVEDKTNGKIRDLIKPIDLTESTRLVLTNAIYFKGMWELQFRPESTTTQPFYITAKQKVNVPMMHQTAALRYGETELGQILEMPYSGGDLSMVVLLPWPERELAALERSLRPDVLRSWLSKLHEDEVEVFLPRFKMEQRFVLNEQLQRLGMIDAFNEGAANFSGMTEGLGFYISKVIHQSFVEVNEEGTEAAAATAIVMGGKSAGPSEPPVFRADHPFLFLIRDVRSGTILFMGRVADPTPKPASS